MLRSMRRDALQWWKGPDKKYFCVMLGFAVVVYFPLMSQKLTNTFDGLWVDTYYIAGGWELSIGRWLWPLADALRFGVQTDPINSLLTLSLVTLSFILVRRLFMTKDSFLTYLLGMAFISSASVSIQLSYRYMSPIFGLSLFLSVAAAYCVIRTENKARAVVQGTVCLTLSLGLYQANLGSFCLILLVYFLMLLFQKLDRSLIHAHIAKSLCSAAAGVVLYYLTLKLILLVTGFQMSEYNGAASVSPLYVLKRLPTGAARAYQIFGIYFFRNQYRNNILQAMGFFALIVLLVGFGLLKRFWRVVRSRDLEYILLSAAALAVLPAICNVTLLITSEATWRLQMAGALDLFIPLCILLLDVTRKKQPQNEKLRMAVIGGTVLLAGLIVYGNVYMRAVDQEAMYEGRKSLKSMTDRIADDLMDFGYFDGEERLPVVFVGRPSSNPTFLMREYYLYANTYAQIGRFWSGSNVAQPAWKSVFQNITPVNLTYGRAERYLEIYAESETEQMPTYPQEGYIRQIGDTVVVKISDDYKDELTSAEEEKPLSGFFELGQVDNGFYEPWKDEE